MSELIEGRHGFGQIALRHDGKPLEVAAHVMVMHRRRGLVFDEHFRTRSQFLGNRLAGVSDLGVWPAASLVAVSNTSDERRRVTLRAVSGQRRGFASISLGPRQTRLQPLAELFREPETHGRRPNDTAVALEAEHNGARGEVLVQGLLIGPDGLAANMRLADRARLRSGRAVSPVLRLHSRQRPRLALYNLGETVLTVTPTVHYRLGETEGRLALEPLALAAGAARGEDLAAALAALPVEARDMGLALEHDGAPGNLVAELLLMETETRAIVPATPKDTEGEGSSAMTFAWRVGDTATTVIAVTNPSATDEIPFHLFLYFDGKTYTWDGGGFLRPGEVKHIDIRRLRDEQIPGQGGVLLPPEVMAGQAKAMVRNTPGQRYKILGQAISMGAQGPVTGSLGCALCWPDPSHVVLSPLSFTSNVGTSQQIYPWIHWADGSSFVNNNPYAIDWYPGNSSVATVSEAWYNFRVQFQGPGTTSITAQMPNECDYEYNYDWGECECVGYQSAFALQAAQVTSKLDFTVTARAFIIPNHVGPDPSSCALGGGVYFKGDERGFSASSSKYRTQQRVVYRSDPNGFLVSHSRSAGQTRSYAQNAISNGRIGSEDEDGVQGDCSLWHQAGSASTGGMNASKSSANGVRINGGASNPLVSGSPQINWDYTINFGVANPLAPTYKLAVTHDCYPAHEAYIGNQTVYTFAPSSDSVAWIATCLAGAFPVTGIRSGVLTP